MGSFLTFQRALSEGKMAREKFPERSKKFKLISHSVVSLCFNAL